MRAVLTALPAAIAVLAIAIEPALASPVPHPLQEKGLEVKQGKEYAFPWTGNIRCEALSPGCFRVEAIHRQALTITYQRFSIKDGRLTPARFFARREITRKGSSEPLFAIEQESLRQMWVHAVYEPGEGALGTIRFFQFPAFVTRKAKIYRTMLLDLPARRLRDHARVEAEEPVTVLTSGAVETLIPGASLTEIRINGQLPRFPVPSVMNLNLPPGRSEVETEMRWKDDKEFVCPWPLYEGRKMSLPAETRLIIRAAGRAPLAISVSSFGLPQQIWESAQVIRGVRPQPERIEQRPLAQILHFPPTDEVMLTIKPVLVVNKFSFPVLVCVESR
ncbi:MAG: hypothetical protein ACE5KI_07915 [Dehalococcoidia bacterium]